MKLEPFDRQQLVQVFDVPTVKGALNVIGLPHARKPSARSTVGRLPAPASAPASVRSPKGHKATGSARPVKLEPADVAESVIK